MTQITADMVRQLRDKAGSSMAEAKAALQLASGDLAQAEALLRTNLPGAHRAMQAAEGDVGAQQRELDQLRQSVAWMREYEKSLNERAKVEQELFDCANGKAPLPSKEQCRQWALRLGVPSEWGRGRK